MPEDQEKVKKIILDGLVEHWGFLDPAKNPDLDDIASAYKQGIFLVAQTGVNLIGCGALIPDNFVCAEVVRMSVAKSFRRHGVGSLILESLIHQASELGVKHIFLETTASWLEAVSFYKQHGFQVTRLDEGNLYFFYSLTN